MGAGAFIEPLVVVTLLFGGTWINRNTRYRLFGRKRRETSSPRSASPGSSTGSGRSSPTSDCSLLSHLDTEPKWRRRTLRILGSSKEVTSPNTRRFKDYFLSRLLKKFPFLVEAWYWALLYWVYQLGRAFTAVTMVEGTVNVARRHALQIIHLEQKLRIFIELDIQRWFLHHPFILHWTNRIYSFIHIPGTILFLVWLFYYTRTPPPSTHTLPLHSPKTTPQPQRNPTADPALYAARRRTLATSNLLAFIIFTLYPCMPPRLLSDPMVPGAIGDEARSYGFVDTVHGAEGESSVWTQNKFCNQYAAMPSLHFGYALLIGVTIMEIPLRERHGKTITKSLWLARKMRVTVKVPSMRRVLCVILGMMYPATILVAIIATANHFVLDAVAGSVVCAVAWWGNGALLNLLVVEDWFLWALRIHKPSERGSVWDENREETVDRRVWDKVVGGVGED